MEMEILTVKPGKPYAFSFYNHDSFGVNTMTANNLSAEVSALLNGFSRSAEWEKYFQVESETTFRIFDKQYQYRDKATQLAHFLILLKQVSGKNWEVYRPTMEQSVKGEFYARGKVGESIPATSVQKNLTPDEWRSTVIRGQVNRDNADTLESIVLSYLAMDKSKVTKAQLSELLDTLVDTLFPTEKREEYEAQAEQYAKDMEAFQSLIEAGFTDITKVDDKGLLQAKVSFEAWQKGANKVILENGYVPVGNPIPDMTNCTFNLQFRKVEKKEEQETA